MTKLTQHFTLEEMTITNNSEWKEINSKPPVYIEMSLKVLCETLLEPIRNSLGPVVVHSGYRYKSLNSAIGGSVTSQHCEGQAADFHVAGHTLEETFEWIINSGLPFGQCILEGKPKPSWIHLSLGYPYRPKERCGEILIYDGIKYTKVDKDKYKKKRP